MISRRIRICLFFLTCLLVVGVVPIYGADPAAELPFDVDALSAVLMDVETGEILYAKNPDEALPPASVTKIMTLLLVMEAIDSGQFQMSDTVSISENVSGSEEAFVRRMNERAAELGMEHTKFENATGLDDDTMAHLTSAEDIAIMSRALLSHEKILEYTSIWMDTIRNGAFGLKTGSTSKAKFCISATAKRDGLHLIAVIMGSPTRDVRNAMATRLLDWGFANFAMYRNPGADAGRIKVLGGVAEDCGVLYGDYSRLMKKGSEKNVTYTVELPDTVAAPITAGDVIGKIVYRCGDTVIDECDVTASESVDKISFWGLFARMLHIFSISA